MPLTVIIVSTQFYPWAFITKFTHLEIIHFSNYFNRTVWFWKWPYLRFTLGIKTFLFSTDYWPSSGRSGYFGHIHSWRRPLPNNKLDFCGAFKFTFWYFKLHCIISILNNQRYQRWLINLLFTFTTQPTKYLSTLRFNIKQSWVLVGPLPMQVVLILRNYQFWLSRIYLSKISVIFK